MSASRHYLDYNATAPLRPEAKAAMSAAMDLTGNPSSVHREGRAARAAIDVARGQVGALAGLPPSSVHFTSGGTEANNWALGQSGRRVLVSAVSHDAALRMIASPADIAPVDHAGLVSAEMLEAELGQSSGPALVSVPAVNNETGVIQPLEDLASLCRSHGAWLHVDAVQAPGKVDLQPIAAAADMISLSAHKIGGPAGCGAMLVRPGLDPEPLLKGGGQEQRRRAGTENLIGIAGFGAAAETVAAAWPSETKLLRELHERLESGINGVCAAAGIIGVEASRVSNTTCVRLPGIAAETVVMALDLAGVAVSAGAACSSGKVSPSHVLRAMGMPEAEAAEAIRISLGWGTTAADVDACIAALAGLWERKRPAA